jgi:hypothetical protein
MSIRDKPVERKPRSPVLAPRVLGLAPTERGGRTVSALSRLFTAECVAGLSRRNLFHIVRFVEAWPDQPQLVARAQYLCWSHFKKILHLKNEWGHRF